MEGPRLVAVVFAFPAQTLPRAARDVGRADPGREQFDRRVVAKSSV
jgi:hypothetical protein